MIFNSQFFEPITYATFIVYGAASETVTFTHSDGTTYSIKTASNGVSSSSLEVITGEYTVKGSVSGYSGTQTITTSTIRVNAWPSNYNIYYWYGHKPIGDWATIATVPSTSPYHKNPVAPSKSESTNSVYFDSTWNYARGGTAYLPKTTIRGSTMHLVCSGVENRYYLALNLCPEFSWAYSPAAVADIPDGATSVSMNIASVSGGSYHPAISMNTKRNAYDAKPSTITVHALYST